MVDIYLHGRQLNSVFELLGTKENDITYSIGWALSQSPSLLDAILGRVLGQGIGTDGVSVYLQEHAEDGGYTDIELIGSKVHLIAEAKRGWWLPSTQQIERYCPRFAQVQGRTQSIVVMSECSPEWANRQLPKDVAGVSVKHMSWREIERLARTVGDTHAEKRLLTELQAYLRRIVSVQNQRSNMVFVVSINSEPLPGSALSSRQMVEAIGRYTHPFGKGWPKEPPNYIGFRFDGRLQYIYHVDEWKVVEDLHLEMPAEFQSGALIDHVVYTLGKPIVPTKQVKNGHSIIRNTRTWAMLDLLLTCDTITEALRITRQRLEEV